MERSSTPRVARTAFEDSTAPPGLQEVLVSQLFFTVFEPCE
jgi:hypothetical protein